MKRKVKFTIFVFTLLVVPFIIIFLSSCNLRETINKPVFYNNKSNYNSNSYYSVTRVKYAKAKESCFLFKTSDVTDASFRNVVFIVPETYFVIVLSDVNTMVKKVQYNNKIGYVSTDSVVEVDFLPINPTLEGVTFDIPDSVGTHLRSAPSADNNSNVLMVIPAGTKSVNYVASIIGTVPTGGSSNIWYYVIYSPMSDPTSVYEGYVYGSKVVNLSEIFINEEGNEEIKTDENDKTESSFVLNDTVRTVLIVLICLPIILVFVLLVVGNKKSKNNKILEGYKPEVKTENVRTSEIRKKNFNKKLNKIDDFENKPLKKKEPYFAKYVEEEFDESSKKPLFPTYETVDDDDLL